MHQQYLWNQLTDLQQFGEAGITGMSGGWATSGTPQNQPQMGTIAANGSYTVIHKLGLSLFN